MSDDAPTFPRPDRDRSDRWLSLDGPWSFESEAGVSTITVPFAWETAASGVGRTWMERGVYRRVVKVPAAWVGARTVLCFGGVHHQARVLCDGAEMLTHVGGATSFEVDLTDRVTPGGAVELTVEVSAPADKRAIPHGKQRSIPRDDYDGVSFTPTSGIWQSVWLEARGRTYLATARLSGESLTGIDIDGRVAGDAPVGTEVRVSVADGGRRRSAVLRTGEDGRVTGRIELTVPRLWSPTEPHLYVVDVEVGTGPDADRVRLTTGLRRIETRGEHLFLNGERLYVRGVLDQGYWPASGLTAPNVGALRHDLDLAKALGFNLVRKHIKLEDPRWLHHADRIGMLVWAEPPAPSRFSPASADAFLEQIAPMVERDGNHPSIVVWGLYNEEWGLDWDIPGSDVRSAAAMTAYDVLKALDPTRPVVENSGWAHVRTDLVDWHYYDEDPCSWSSTIADLASGEREDFPVRLGPDFVVDKSLYGSADIPRHGLPVLNSEYGGGFTSLERAWHMRWQTQELRRHDRFAGYVYTELADVEHEMAGVVDANRQPKDLGGMRLTDVHAETVLVLDVSPACAGADIPVPTDALPLTVRVSHHGAGTVMGRVRAAWVPPGRPFSKLPPPPHAESGPVKAEPFQLSESVTVDVPPPGIVASARLHVWLVDDSGAIRACSYVDAAPIESPNRRGARVG